eukprot:CAMPEP_0197690118 /NCGR_PEP_ID=MMETSP1338-20131121/107901_1 /TAXON_ID=43686 ORGANISM="Pelagodinium beii, Strain RCC1491" /NCGR_SAMPLE_ID=MMETSP1338 /ASSEMBLY_ACC=CAM_ASM_000754 /LENGTH=96 /DNA_ID=CAMNT_0043272531 /DNA_START=1 /DNA_END=287 /DNA_ORIENTATION=+
MLMRVAALITLAWAYRSDVKTDLQADADRAEQMQPAEYTRAINWTDLHVEWATSPEDALEKWSKACGVPQIDDKSVLYGLLLIDTYLISAGSLKVG